MGVLCPGEVEILWQGGGAVSSSTRGLVGLIFGGVKSHRPPSVLVGGRGDLVGPYPWAR